ncbi:MAG: hypothetical protein LBD93_10055, partial [Treponema sp.]|nr:hypothetical protein [Treponema sp.]
AINADIGGGDYTITLKADRGATAITFTGTVAKRIILKGVSPVRIITNNGTPALYRSCPYHPGSGY